METATAFFREWNNHKQAALSIGLGLFMLLLIYAANALISIDDIVMHIEIAGQGPSAAARTSQPSRPPPAAAAPSAGEFDWDGSGVICFCAR